MLVWTDRQTSDGHGQMVNDHNSSLSTPCSGELKTMKKQISEPEVGQSEITNNRHFLFPPYSLTLQRQFTTSNGVYLTLFSTLFLS